MAANVLMLPKGPALLAQAGVTLAEAQWLYRQSRAQQAAGNGDPRAAGIREKVKAFLAARPTRTKAEHAFA